MPREIQKRSKGERKVTIAVRVGQDLVLRLQQLAVQRQIDFADLVRCLLASGVESLESAPSNG